MKLFSFSISKNFYKNNKNNLQTSTTTTMSAPPPEPPKKDAAAPPAPPPSDPTPPGTARAPSEVSSKKKGGKGKAAASAGGGGGGEGNSLPPSTSPSGASKWTALRQVEVQNFSDVRPALLKWLDGQDKLFGAAEKSSGLEREKIFYGICGILSLWLIAGPGGGFICNLIGVAYPASILALRSLQFWLCVRFNSGFAFFLYLGFTSQLSIQLSRTEIKKKLQTTEED
ncbi:hypothetical protein ACQ4LE_000035 [Meloidogyne hapla]